MYLRLEMAAAWVLLSAMQWDLTPRVQRVLGSQSSHYDDCTPAWWLHQRQMSSSPSRETSSSAKGKETFSRSRKYQISGFSIFWFEEERTAYKCQVSACLLRYYQTCTLACPSQSNCCVWGQEGRGHPAYRGVLRFSDTTAHPWGWGKGWCLCTLDLFQESVSLHIFRFFLNWIYGKCLRGKGVWNFTLPCYQ